jgi:hypothetical protein
MRGEISIKDLAVETNINGNYVVYFQHTQEGHKTPVELRPIPSLVNQMCLVYDSSTNRFVPQDLATYVENTPSFENKIREVAGTAELVVEDGSAVVAKVNVYDDSTYLPLAGNNPGDQAFATDTNILYIWDGSAWQQAGTTNSDDLTEGSTNIFYTDARVSSYLTSNDYDTATNIVASIVDTAPTTLDTLNELAAALGDDPNFATTTANNIALKLAITDFTNTADTWLGTKSTTDVAEGTNLYYTNTRFDTRLATKTTTDIAEGTNQYFTTARVQGTTIDAGSLRGTVNNATVQYGTAYSGTPVQGSFFFDSLNQKLKVYTGSAFVDAVPAGTGGGEGGGETAANATFRKYTYSITSSTNAVSGADDNAETLSYVTDGTQNVEVYVNGVKQVEGGSNDYVASTGTSVTFVDNLASGDVVDIQVYELLTNDAYYLKTETYTQTETNSQISTAIAGLVDSAPTTLDTLNELAAALGDDPNFATTVTNSIADKLPLSGGTLTGNLDVTSSRSTVYSATQDQRSLAHIIARNGSDASGRFASISLVSGGGTQAEGSINLVQTGNYVGDLAFKLRAGGGSTDWRERMRINSSGFVGINSDSPAAQLEIETLGGSWSHGLSLKRSDNGNAINFVIDGTNNHRLNIGSPGGVARIRMDEGNNAYFELVSPSAVLLPKGDESNRPGNTGASATSGQFRYSTSINKLEYRDNLQWQTVAIQEPYGDYNANGLQLFFDANRSGSWVSGSNPYDLISGSQASLTNVSNTITTNSPSGANAMYFNDTGTCQWPGGVLSYPRTYEIWICSQDWTGTNWQSFTDDNSTESILFGAPSNTPYVYTSTQTTSAVTLQNNVWYQIAYTCNGLSGGSGTIYVNGSQNATYSGLTRSGPSTGSTLYMGGDSGQGESVKGWIAILRTYNRILSSSEIVQNWNNDKTKFGY